MRKLFAAGVSAVLLVVSAPSVWAGSGSAGGTTVSWDDSKMYLPKQFSCNSLVFNYVNDDTTNYSSVDLINAYGEKLGGAVLSGSSGNASMQVCGSKDFVEPLVLRVESSQKFEFGGADQITDLPFSFNKQSQFVRCIKKSNFKQKRYQGKWAQQDKCPKGWVKVTI